MAIKCFFADDSDFGCNYTCIPYDKRLEKSTNGDKKDHPCPFHDFGECQEWMEGKKFEFLWDIWCKRYDQGGINSSDFYEWTRDLEKLKPDIVWKFIKHEYDKLRFIGYEDPRWVDREKMEHRFELFSFSPLGQEDPRMDCCINDSCSTWCKNYITCPVRRYRKELLKIGIPHEIKMCQSYNRFKWHINKIKKEVAEGHDKKHTDEHMSRVIWFALREIAAEDFASTETISRRQFIPMKNQNLLPMMVEI
jgi:hypothetical protein